MPPPSDFIPRQYYQQQVTALEGRCVAAEGALVDLLHFIDPDILERNAFDWKAAVRELVS